MQKREGHFLKKVVSLVLGKKGRRAILWIFQNVRFCFRYPFQQIPFRAVNCEKIENLHSCRHQFQLVNFLLGDDFCKKFIPYEDEKSSWQTFDLRLTSTRTEVERGSSMASFSAWQVNWDPRSPRPNFIRTSFLPVPVPSSSSNELALPISNIKVK